MMESILFILILAPLLGAAAVALAPPQRAKSICFWFMLACAGLTAFPLFVFDWSRASTTQFYSHVSWLPKLGLNLSVGVDSVAIMLIALTGLLGPICAACSFTAVTERLKTYYAWLLVLQSAMFAVFAARDLVLFYIAFEFTLVPMYVLISLYGSTNRKKAATKFFLYTFTGSMIALAGLVYVAWHAAQMRGGVWNFDIATLELAARTLPPSAQAWVLAALLAGFAVKVPLFPVHTWLPLAHTEAPTAGSVILAGVLLKLGTYGIYRFAIPFAPAAFAQYAPAIATVCIIGILYGGLICWVQTDVKKLVAYSSVAHLGFCILGMTALNTTGLSGSVLYMLNHGLSTGALFLLIGMIYERYHTRNMKELGGLAAKMPVWATFMVFFAMASVGLPGLNGFVSEILCLLGAFQASSTWGAADAAGGHGLWGSADALVPGATPGNLGPWYAAIAGVGMIVAAMYLLYMVGRVVFGPLVEPAGHHHDAHGHDPHASSDKHAHANGLPTDLNLREILILSPLAVLCLVMGVYPKPFLEALNEPVQRTAFMVQEAREGYGVLRGRTAEGSLIPAAEHRPTPLAPPAAAPAGRMSTDDMTDLTLPAVGEGRAQP